MLVSKLSIVRTRLTCCTRVCLSAVRGLRTLSQLMTEAQTACVACVTSCKVRVLMLVPDQLAYSTAHQLDHWRSACRRRQRRQARTGRSTLASAQQLRSQPRRMTSSAAGWRKSWPLSWRLSWRRLMRLHPQVCARLQMLQSPDQLQMTQHRRQASRQLNQPEVFSLYAALL